MELSYILKLRKSLKEEYKNMPLFQNGSAIIVVNSNGCILLELREDRNLWCIPGGLQELGETFEQVAVRELKEETGLEVDTKDLRLVGVISGESRKNTYPNGDQVYNNTVLYMINKYSGNLDCNYEEITEIDGKFKIHKESKELKFFPLDSLPSNLMDVDLIMEYRRYYEENSN